MVSVAQLVEHRSVARKITHSNTLTWRHLTTIWLQQFLRFVPQSSHALKPQVNGRIRRMNGVSIWTWVFYFAVISFIAVGWWFIWQYWDRASSSEQLRWINVDNRTMYVDALKTMITASGIAVALVASSAVGSVRNKNPIVEFSAKVAVVCLVSCVCLSLTAIMALLRGYELAQAKFTARSRATGTKVNVEEQGPLTNHQLLCILVLSGLSVTCFVVGFVFLGRIALHF
jgi:hypothetical protein